MNNESEKDYKVDRELVTECENLQSIMSDMIRKKLEELKISQMSVRSYYFIELTIAMLAAHFISMAKDAVVDGDHKKISDRFFDLTFKMIPLFHKVEIQ